MATGLARFFPSLARAGRFPRLFSVSAALRSTQEDLERAKTRVMQLKQDPGNQAKLQLYSLYKQVSARKNHDRARVLHTRFPFDICCVVGYGRSLQYLQARRF